MTKQTTVKPYNVPAALIEQCGTYVGETNLIGKKIRIIQDSPVHPLAFLLGLPEESSMKQGAEGVVIHVDAEGVIWADFGEDERVLVRETPEGDFRIYDVGNVDLTNDDFITLYEVIGEEDAGYAQEAA